MRNFRAKRGSALLIVLGMVSVMVISAVAFSAWMRYSRLPSSYLRRTSASRHLVHAAMAEAIDYIDLSIGDNPHPGFGDKATQYPRLGGDLEKRNYWRDNCFIGTNQLADAEETVSVLSLEALAYIPPALVNEARYYSRHTPTASWKRLGYDAGRYAFFAIDVSDCLDVNITPADFGRNSSDRGKFTLAHVFENNMHSGYTVNPSVWDEFLDKYVDIDALRDGVKPSTSKMPFWSLADLGLAVYSAAGGIGKQLCPIIGLIDGGSVKIDDAAAMNNSGLLGRFMVIADGQHPSVAVKSNLPGDLADARRQPFPRMKKGNAKTTNREVLTLVDGGTSQMIEENMTLLDMISLYDYLDDNDLPVSLALPTVERNPMICGLQSTVQLKLKPKLGKEEADGDGAKKRAECKDIGDFYIEITQAKLDFNGVGGFSAMYMFPFRRDKDIPNASCSGETSLRICFATESPGLRVDASAPYVLQNNSDFSATGVGDCALRPTVQTVSLSFSAAEKPEDALEKKDSTVKFNEVDQWFRNNVLFWVKKKYVVVALDPENGTPQFQEEVKSRAVGINPDFHPVGKNGKGDGGFTEDKIKGSETFSVKVKPYMSVVSRLTKGSDTVDLVPACYNDDKKYNNVASDVNIANIAGGSGSTPIMLFSGDTEIEFGFKAFEEGKEVTVTISPTDAQSVFCPDPRWNFAPESFVRVNEPLDKSWYTGNGARCGLGRDGRDNDIFMFVSNQGYMQSVSELAFLPRTSVAFGGGSETTGNAAFSFADRDNFPASVENAANWDLMWRTYRLYDQGGGATADPIYDIGLFDGGSGQRVNPYTSSRNALMAVFANTPYSWWAASTNNQVKSLEDLDAQTFNKNYAFSEMNSSAKFAWKDLEKIADEFRRLVRNRAQEDSQETADWTQAWQALDWANLENSLNFDGDTDDLYGVDRKFLYGFWRDCFAAKQQLFLVFARAEPMMMGSGAIGQAPPQLGARAVALVWRNPTPNERTGVIGGKRAWPLSMDNVRKAALNGANDGASTDTGRPHQTRVLFYRQFD